MRARTLAAALSCVIAAIVWPKDEFICRNVGIERGIGGIPVLQEIWIRVIVPLWLPFFEGDSHDQTINWLAKDQSESSLTDAPARIGIIDAAIDREERGRPRLVDTAGNARASNYLIAITWENREAANRIFGGQLRQAGATCPLLISDCCHARNISIVWMTVDHGDYPGIYCRRLPIVFQNDLHDYGNSFRSIRVGKDDWPIQREGRADPRAFVGFHNIQLAAYSAEREASEDGSENRRDSEDARPPFNRLDSSHYILFGATALVALGFGVLCMVEAIHTSRLGKPHNIDRVHMALFVFFAFGATCCAARLIIYISPHGS